MKKTIKKVLRFAGFLLLVLLLAFTIQNALQSQFLGKSFQHLITEAYLANYLLVLLTFALILLIKQKHNASIGFIFIFGFLIKMAVFFIFFKGNYQADGEIQTSEFASFFVPYALCLILETHRLVQILNRT